MKRLCLPHTIALITVCFSSPVFSEDAAAPAQPGNGVTTVYRQKMPNGRIVYSDKLIKGGKLDKTIIVEPTIKGNVWTAESGNRPVIPSQVEPTPIRHVNRIPSSEQKRTFEEATSDVIRAEMLLEDARKRQQAGVEPLPGERTGTVTGRSRLNDAYFTRQQLLENETAEADAALRRAIADREMLRTAP